MAEIDIQQNERMGVDKELIRMFLRMSPEERIRTNDNTIRTIADLRDAFKKRKAASSGSERPA